MARRVLVTGGAGFIGSHLVRRLLERGDEVRVLDNLSSGRQANLAGLEDSLDLREGDIRNPEVCQEACRGADSVFHLAALGSVARSIEFPLASNEVNVTGTLNLLVAARDAGVRRFVFSSSSSVYGNTPVFPKREDAVLSPCSPYAVTKLAGEEYCRVFGRAYGLETVALRYFNVFGPRQDPNSQYAAVIPSFISSLLSRRQPVVYGDGLQSRDFTYVANVVEANLLASEVPGVAGETFNIACGEEISLNDILARLGELLESEVRPRYLPPRPGDIRRSLADISAARQRLGYAPKVRFAEGLAQTVSFFAESADQAQLPTAPAGA